MKRILLPFFVLFAISSVARSAETPALIDRPAAGAGPTQVSVGIWIVDITNIDSAQQNFTADLAIVFRWKDARLAHTGTGVAYYALDQIWTPQGQSEHLRANTDLPGNGSNQKIKQTDRKKHYGQNR